MCVIKTYFKNPSTQIKTNTLINEWTNCVKKERKTAKRTKERRKERKRAALQALSRLS